MRNKSNVLQYKGFIGSIQASVEDEVLFGKIECINDVITYEADGMKELTSAFHEAVDDYIETCSALGKDPEKTLSGSFNVRIGSDLHRKVYLKALSKGEGLNEYIKSALESSLDDRREVHIHIPVSQSKTHETYKGQFEVANPKGDNFSSTSSSVMLKVRH